VFEDHSVSCPAGNAEEGVARIVDAVVAEHLKRRRLATVSNIATATLKKPPRKGRRGEKLGVPPFMSLT
jgi:hypothetical protein